MNKHKYKSQEEIEEATHEIKRGKFKTGRIKKEISNKQAVEIGLFEAREANIELLIKFYDEK